MGLAISVVCYLQADIPVIMHLRHLSVNCQNELLLWVHMKLIHGKKKGGNPLPNRSMHSGGRASP